MTTANDVEQYLNSLGVDYKLIEDDESIQVKLHEYNQSIFIKKNNDFEYTKETIDSVFKNAELGVNQQCAGCGGESNIWQLCHTCNKEVCINCYIEQRLSNHGANICSLCNAINNPYVMTNDELDSWLININVDIDNILALHDE